MVNEWWWLVLLALVVIGVLGTIAGRLLWQLRHQRRAQRQRADETARQARRGIQVLAGSYLAGQVEASEAALRITVLLDQSAVSDQVRQQARPFVALAEELADVPTHRAWKALPDAQRRAFRRQMDVLETRHREALETAAQALVALLDELAA